MWANVMFWSSLTTKTASMTGGGSAGNTRKSFGTVWQKTAFIAVIMAMSLSLTPYPVSAQSGESRPAQEELINRAEMALMSMTTMRADFIQFASDGSASEGRVYFRRPFQLRIDYTNPPDLSFVTSRVWIHVDDKIDKQVTSYPISQSPFAPLLKREIMLRGEDVDVSARLDDGVAAVTLQKKEGEAAGSLTLEFDVQSWRLRRWVITDAVGIQTQVTLQNPVYDVSLANKLFAKPAYAVPADN